MESIITPSAVGHADPLPGETAMSRYTLRSAALIVASALLAGAALAGDPPAAPATEAQPATAPAAAQAAPVAAEAPATTAAPAAGDKPKAAAQVTCREEKRTGSRLQKQKVCSTPDSQKGSADWVREQQARGAIGASAIVNGQ
jgi:hypothetical protein